MASCLGLFFFFLLRGMSQKSFNGSRSNYVSAVSIMSLRSSISLQKKFLDNSNQQQQHNHGLGHGFQRQHRAQTSRWHQVAARSMHINMVLCYGEDHRGISRTSKPKNEPSFTSDILPSLRVSANCAAGQRVCG